MFRETEREETDMKYTSAEAAKLLRKFMEERHALLAQEAKCKAFHAALGEDPETVRPAYDFAAAQAELAAVEGKIRRVKHAINVFNTTTVVPGVGMTIDELLVYLPQLTETKEKLSGMAAVLPKERDSYGGYGGSAGVIDYTYANYAPEEARAAYVAVADRLAAAQTALDLVNSTVRMDIEL